MRGSPPSPPTPAASDSRLQEPHISSMHCGGLKSRPQPPAKPSAKTRPQINVEETTQASTRTVWTPSGSLLEDQDTLAREEPLEIRVGQSPLAVLMRSPDHDEELVTGFMISEGIASATQLKSVRHCSVGDNTENVVLVSLSDDHDIDLKRFARHHFTSSSCGICGKKSIEQALQVAPALNKPVVYPGKTLTQAAREMRSQQHAFQACGSLHAAALINPSGEILIVREDVGRHNALDKVIGWAARSHVALQDKALLLSGRCSFEMVQKSLAAQIGTIAAIGGVSSLAQQLAQQANIHLAGFARADRLSVYSGEVS